MNYSNSRALAFTFPSSLQRWLAIFITSVVMSLAHGAIFWNVRSSHQSTLPEQEDINDRMALHYVMATVAIWPTLMLMVTDVWKERDSLARDLQDRLYGRFVYFISKVSTYPDWFILHINFILYRCFSPPLLKWEFPNENGACFMSVEYGGHYWSWAFQNLFPIDDFHSKSKDGKYQRQHPMILEMELVICCRLFSFIPVGIDFFFD